MWWMKGYDEELKWLTFVYCEQMSAGWILTAVVTVNARWLLTSLIHNDNASVSRDGSETDAIKVRFRWMDVLLVLYSNGILYRDIITTSLWISWLHYRQQPWSVLSLEHVCISSAPGDSASLTFLFTDMTVYYHDCHHFRILYHSIVFHSWLKTYMFYKLFYP